LLFGFSLISLSFSQSLSSQSLVNQINLESPLMNWSRRYRVNSYIRSSVWILPLVAAVVEQAAAALAHMLDARLAWTGNVSILVLLVLLVIIHFSDLLGAVGSGALVPAAIFIAALGAAGYFLGGSRNEMRGVLELGTGAQCGCSLRSCLPKLFSDPKIMITLVASAIFADRASPCRALAAAKSAGSSTRNGDPKSAQ
jgi:hypothetical protein